jgi:hypothetical protein
MVASMLAHRDGFETAADIIHASASGQLFDRLPWLFDIFLIALSFDRGDPAFTPSQNAHITRAICWERSKLKVG